MSFPVLARIGYVSTFCLSAGVAFAQQADDLSAGGPVLTFGLSSTVSVDDNYSLSPNGGDSAELFDNRLSLGYLDQRTNDTLKLDLDGVLRGIEPPGGASRTLDDPRLRLSYDLQGVNSTLSASAEYRQTSVNFLDPFDSSRFFNDEPLEPSDLIQDDGDREQIATRFTFVTGVNDPIGFTLEGRYREQTYKNTIDPGLFDNQNFGLTGTTRFDLSPASEARIVLRYDDYSADDALQTDRQTSSLSLGFTQTLSKVDTLDVSLGFQNIETEETVLGLPSTNSQSDVIGGFSLTRELTRGGTVGTEFDLRESVNGRTATWLVNRAMPLPRGAIDFSFGVARDVDGTLHPVGSVDFTHEMLRSTFTVALERQVTTSVDSDELLVTRGSLKYTFELNSLSNVAFAADFVETNQAGGPTVNDTTRANLSATYSRDLTRDWQLSSGYEYRMRDETGVGTATSNRLFVTMGREFSIRP
jgi:hypothetical protein